MTSSIRFFLIILTSLLIGGSTPLLAATTITTPNPHNGEPTSSGVYDFLSKENLPNQINKSTTNNRRNNSTFINIAEIFSSGNKRKTRESNTNQNPWKTISPVVTNPRIYHKISDLIQHPYYDAYPTVIALVKKVIDKDDTALDQAITLILYRFAMEDESFKDLKDDKKAINSLLKNAARPSNKTASQRNPINKIPYFYSR